MVCRRGLALAAFLAFGTACGLSAVGSSTPPPDGTPVIDGGTDAGGEPDAGGDADSFVYITQHDDAGCPSGRGPAMLKLFSPALCIDESEVSARQYKAFVDDFAAGHTPVQIAECVANLSVVPQDVATQMTPSLDSDSPVDRIDWCDAHLFCRWAGKHLCARRDGTETYITSANANDATISEFFAACSQDGAANGVPATANLAANTGITGRDSDDQVDVLADPPGGPLYDGKRLHHIVGNVEEWADGCDGTGTCVARGSSVKTATTTNCTTRTTHLRMDRAADLGFRCCATAPE